MARPRTVSNTPGRYDRARVARIVPLEAALRSLQLPPSRARKAGVILSALEVQIEDHGDNPEVNRLLLDTLRAGGRHQVSEHQARKLLQAIDAFEQAELAYWRDADQRVSRNVAEHVARHEHDR